MCGNVMVEAAGIVDNDPARIVRFISKARFGVEVAA